MVIASWDVHGGICLDVLIRGRGIGILILRDLMELGSGLIEVLCAESAPCGRRGLKKNGCNSP